MIEAIAWKEWREQRVLVGSGIALALLIPIMMLASVDQLGKQLLVTDPTELLRPCYILLLWPWIAAAAGAGATGGEIGDGTIEALVARPIGRLRLWLIKVAVAGASVIVVAAASLGAEQGYLLLSDPAKAGMIATSGLGSIIAMDHMAPVAAFCFLAFALGVLLGLVLGRVWAAIGTSLACAAVAFSLVSALSVRLDLVHELQPTRVTLLTSFVSLLVLASAAYAFRTAEILSLRARVRCAGRSLLGCAAVVLLLWPPFLIAMRHVDVDTARVTRARMSPRGDLVAVTLTARDDASSELWMLPLDGDPPRRIGRSLADYPLFTRDGSQVAYRSNVSTFGLAVRGEGYYRIVDVDGQSDRALPADWLYASRAPDNVANHSASTGGSSGADSEDRAEPGSLQSAKPSRERRRRNGELCDDPLWVNIEEPLGEPPAVICHTPSTTSRSALTAEPPREDADPYCPLLPGDLRAGDVVVVSYGGDTSANHVDQYAIYTSRRDGTGADLLTRSDSLPWVLRAADGGWWITTKDTTTGSYRDWAYAGGEVQSLSLLHAEFLTSASPHALRAIGDGGGGFDRADSERGLAYLLLDLGGDAWRFSLRADHVGWIDDDRAVFVSPTDGAVTIADATTRQLIHLPPIGAERTPSG